MLQTELSDSKQKVEQFELKMIKLQENNKILEAQLISVQVVYANYIHRRVHDYYL